MANINDPNENVFDRPNGNGSGRTQSLGSDRHDLKQSFDQSKEQFMEDVEVELGRLDQLVRSKVFWGVTIGVLGAIGAGVAIYLTQTRKPTLSERFVEAFEVISDTYPKIAKKASRVFS